MGGISRGQALVVTTLVTAMVLGAAYLLGHSLGSSVGPARPGAAARDRAGTGATYPDEGGPARDGGTEHGGGPASGTATEPVPAPGDGLRPGTAAPRTDPSFPSLSSAPTPATPPPTKPGADDRTPGPTYGGPLPPDPNGPHGARLTTGSSAVALTFDDGPDPRFTPQILALLREFGVTATFCVVGENARAHPELIRAIVADGHTLCNHSWSHDVELGERPYAEIVADLARTGEAIRAAVPGATVSYYRQPGGKWTESVATAARQLGMTPLHWAVDPQDWTRPGAGTVAASVTANVFPGAVVLLHDAGGDRQDTVDALYPILVSLDRRYELIALPTGAGHPATGVAAGTGAAPGRHGRARADAGQATVGR
jgi:peptidoglycan/xylan/chitin deacetylase (PgdA/CDA1 family)